MSPDSFGKTRN